VTTCERGCHEVVTGDNLMPLTNTETPRAGAGKRATLSPHEETAMQKAGTIPQHNYVRKIHQMWETGAIPREAGYHHLVIEHGVICTNPRTGASEETARPRREDNHSVNV